MFGGYDLGATSLIKDFPSCSKSPRGIGRNRSPKYLKYPKDLLFLAMFAGVHLHLSSDVERERERDGFGGVLGAGGPLGVEFGNSHAAFALRGGTSS